MSHLHNIVDEWQCTELPDEADAEVLLIQKRLLKHCYVQVNTQKVKL